MWVTEYSIIQIERSEKSINNADRGTQSMRMTEFSVPHMFWSCVTLGISTGVERFARTKKWNEYITSSIIQTRFEGYGGGGGAASLPRGAGHAMSATKKMRLLMWTIAYIVIKWVLFHTTVKPRRMSWTADGIDILYRASTHLYFKIYGVTSGTNMLMARTQHRILLISSIFYLALFLRNSCRCTNLKG
jgi:hypothetical protein